MKLIKSEKKEKSIVELEISVSGEEFNIAIEKAYRKNIGKFNVQGFRKGKAPRKMVEQLYGKSVFYEEAINLSYPEAYDKALAEANLDAVGRADIDIKDFNENGEGYIFTALVPVRPEVSVSDYKGLKAPKKPVSVTGEDVEKELENLQKRASRLQKCDRAVQSGDTAVIDFEGFIDGLPFEGGKGESHSLVIGSGQFIPGFEEQLIGLMPGAEPEVNVNFPEDYHAAAMAGKKALFKCRIQEVKETILPALDDEFAKDVSEFETIEALKEDLTKKLLEAKGKNAETEFEENIIGQIIDKMQADIPDVMIETQQNQMVNDYGYRLSAQGINLDDYLKLNQMDQNSFKEMIKPQAERQVKTMLALSKISELENVNITEEELEDEYKKLAERYTVDVEKVKSSLPPETLKSELKINRTVDLIRDSAVAVSEEANP